MTLEIVGVLGLWLCIDDVIYGVGEGFQIVLRLVDDECEGIDWDDRDGLYGLRGFLNVSMSPEGYSRV